ncbi:ABC transporter ATP-binding protein [Halobacterium zhouii]|uniref:ABC transporter ATP-binding protein n=1 Tax=Halobacterium zhouii TaxID=2902624 RepID=UPI001E609E9D|nr:ABC transporter ATP-binding protein [Halobacterium zhouii]
MLELTALSKTYDGFDFGPLDLSLGDEVLSVLGPSGSGKTTLLSLVAGLVTPDAGDISLDGRPLVGRPVEARRTGLVFQDGALFPHMTARENVAYAATDPSCVDELAERLEITDVLDRRPSTLSGGERQRVALARTLAADPAALLLDEPLSSLDAPIRRRLRDELHSLFASLDIPVVYVTHDQRTATALGDRIAILRDGAVEQVGTPDDVLDRPQTRFVAQFTGNENIFEADVADHSESGTTLEIGGVVLQTDASSVGASSVTACVHPSRVQLRAPSEDGHSNRENALSGTIRRWLNEGTEYRVVVDVDDAPLSLVATVRPRTFDALPAESGAPVRIVIPSGAVHLIR